MAAKKKTTQLVESIPPHILASDHLSGVQRKAFGKAKSAAKKAPAKKGSAKKTPRAKAVKSASAAPGSGYGLASGKEEKP